jgi:hypothetical protein
VLGLNCESEALTPLRQIVPGLDAAVCKDAILALQTMDEQREPLADTMNQQAALERELIPLRLRIARMIHNRTLDPVKEERATCEYAIHQIQKLTRETMLELAAHAYELEHGTRPQTIADLVPAYLKAVPQDPFTHTNLVYLP